jgi:hypothetical protein
MTQGKQRSPRGAHQAENIRLIGALTRIQELIREAGLKPATDGSAWETLGAVAFIVNRALAPAAS